MAESKLSYGQVKSLVEQLQQDEIDMLTEYLETKKLGNQLRKFREKMKDVPLSMEEINVEVKSVREEMSREGRY